MHPKPAPRRTPHRIRRSTRERILEASLVLFNEQGFGNTPIAQVADAIGIAQGNLWYHFRTKHDLLRALVESARERFEEHLAVVREAGPIFEGYVSLTLGTMQEMWDFRFLLRDRLEFGELDPIAETLDVADAHFRALRALLGRMQSEGHFRGQAPDLDVLATNLWILLRYWWDFLREREGIGQPSAQDNERAFGQLLAVLAPHLTREAQRQLQAVVAASMSDPTVARESGVPR